MKTPPQEVEARWDKTWTVYRALINCGSERYLEGQQNVKIFNSNVKAVLLYASESWYLVL